MKKVFFILLFICSSFLYGQNQEKLVISGWKQETGVIDYYENGLIKNFTYGNNPIKTQTKNKPLQFKILPIHQIT